MTRSDTSAQQSEDPPFELLADPEGQNVAIQPAGADHTLAGKLRRWPGVGRLVESEPVARLAAAVGLGRLLRPAVPFVFRHLSNSTAVGSYRLRAAGVGVVLRHGTTDVWTVNELFNLGLYDPPAPVLARMERIEHPVRVLDLGANVGLFAALARTRFPSSPITAFEPDPGNLRVLRRFTEMNRSTGPLEIVEACAGATDGHVEFAASGDSGAHALDPRSDEKGIEVERRDVFPWLAGTDLLKMDIEGGEWDILGDPRFSEGPPVVVLEYHPYLCPSDDPTAEVRALFAAAGYEVKPIYTGADGHGMLWAWRP